MLRVRSLLFSMLMLAVSGSLLRAQVPAPPGPEHEQLKSLEGTWDAAIKYGTDESKGKAVYKMGLGGFWLMSDFEGDFGGQTFSGHGMDSYDPAKKKYVAVWCDSMTPTPMISEGELSKDGKTKTMLTEMTGPDGNKQKLKLVHEFKDKDTMVFSMYGPDENVKEPMMQITYKRKK